MTNRGIWRGWLLAGLIVFVGCWSSPAIVFEEPDEGDMDGDADHESSGNDGDMIDGDHPDGDWPDGDHPDGDHPDGDHPDGDHPDGDHPDGDHPDGDWPDGDHPDGDHPDGDHPDGDWPDGDWPDGDWPDGDHPDGDHPDGDHPDGDIPYDDCAVPVLGPDRIVLPLDEVRLDASYSYDPNDAFFVYKWVWEAKPAGAEGVVLYDENDYPIEGIFSREARPHFVAELAGTYIIRLILKNNIPACTGVYVGRSVVVAVPDRAIHVELTWSEPENDHDLHLIRPGGLHTRSCGAVNNVDDCCWQNCNTEMGINPECPARGCPGPSNAPDWGRSGNRADDPKLDVDDVNGTGPENINLNDPQLGEYLITVENYSSSDSVALTVKVWLFGELRGTFRYDKSAEPEPFPIEHHWMVCRLDVRSSTDISLIVSGDGLGTIQPSQ